MRSLLRAFAARLDNDYADALPLKAWQEEEESPRKRVSVSLFRKHVEECVSQSRLSERLVHAKDFPLNHSPTSLPELVAQCIATVWYLSRRYPSYFKEPSLYNQYLSFLVRCRLPSAKAAFGDCYEHFPLSEEQEKELHVLDRSRLPPFWPFPRISIPFLPEQLPRPDKFTFVRSMEYAHFMRDADFATEVWIRRESWRSVIEKTALDDLGTSMWSEFGGEDLVRYERELVDNRTSARAWAKTAATLRKWSEGASNTMYEGYTRLLYIQTLAGCGQGDKAYKMVLQGTGEKYAWTQSMLAKVRKRAEKFGHTELCEYIDGLERSEGQNLFGTISDEMM
jgi:hypothetical protein